MVRWAIWLVVLGLTTGCSSFNREWKRVAANPTPANDLTGRWNGTWLSHANGHHGRLRCIITPLDGNRYSAWYHATFRKLINLSATYKVPLTVTRTNGQFTFEGTADLGWLGGGVYTYYGAATATNFQSSYSSKADHGIFEMKRPQVEQDGNR